MKNFPTMTWVVAAALIRADGQILMQMRPLAKEHGGLWEFPGGKVEVGESPEMALIREIREELDIEIAAPDLIPFAFSSSGGQPVDGGRPLVILLYTCRIWQGKPRNLDAEKIAWFDPAALIALEMPPLDIPLAKRLAEAWK
jgi:8-oxo-dGTP diphosphatase